MVTLGSLCSTLARTARNMGSSPAVGKVFPIFITPTTIFIIHDRSIYLENPSAELFNNIPIPILLHSYFFVIYLRQL